MKTFIFYGGWSGHTPKESAELTGSKLRENGAEVILDDKLDSLNDLQFLETLDLIVPMWTMGRLSDMQTKNLSTAVKNGVGLAGFHGGMGDAFRGNIEYEWMTGGIFVGHPYVGKYIVNIPDCGNPLVNGMKKSFEYESEQYYMLTDPGNDILATAVYRLEGKEIKMPVVWTKAWGKGKVFYSALGHSSTELVKNPEVLDMTIRGMRWAAK